MTQLAETLRGLLRPTVVNPLEGKIGRAGSLRELQAILARIDDAVGPKARLTGHKTFDSLWRRELRAICNQLVWDRAIELEGDEDVAPDPLSEIRGLGSGTTSADETLDEEDVPRHLTSPIDPGSEVPSDRTHVAEAGALAFQRRSNAELLRHPDHILPARLVDESWDAACQAAGAASQDRNVEDLEGQIALLLCIEAGLAESEVTTVVLGKSTDGGVLALDLEGQALRRPEARPPKAFQPKEEDEAIWLPTGGDAVFPLSDNVVAFATELISLRGKDAALARCSLLLSRTDPRANGVIRRAIQRAAPQLPIVPSLFRKRIAAILAEKLGMDAAQLAFGESFGTSTAATYYFRLPADQLASCVWGASAGATRAPAELPTNFVRPRHFLGSRAAPASSPIAELWQLVGHASKRQRGQSSPTKLLALWKSKRDLLAIHILIATGCRPNRSLADVTFWDLLPEHALVVISDKRSDPAHLTRVASTGWRFVAELEHYLNFVASLARNPSLAAVRRVAKGILDGTTPLFSVASQKGVATPLNVSKLMQTVPASWRNKTNLHRHMMCNALAAAGVDPELRYFQLGWIASSAHAASDLCPYSMVEASEGLAKQVDLCLAQMGWHGGEKCSGHFDWSDSPPLRVWNKDLEIHQRSFKEQCRHLRALLAERRGEVRPAVHQELTKAIEEVLPSYRLQKSSGYVVLRPKDSKQPLAERQLIDAEIVRTILARFDGSAFSSLQEIVAVSELARLLREGVRKGVFKAYIPSVPVLSLSREPSPFLRGNGLAVRQAHRLRDRALELAREVNELNPAERALPLACLSWLAIMCFTPYRFADKAREIVRACTRACHSDASPTIVRVPLLNGHAALSGQVAILLRRLATAAGAEETVATLTDAVLGDYIRSELRGLVPDHVGVGTAIQMLEQTLQVAGRIELSGIERTIMLTNIQGALVTAERAASVEDQVTIPIALGTEPQADDTDEARSEEKRPARRNPHHRPPEKNVVEEVLPFFSPDYAGEIDGKPAKSPSSRSGQLILAVTARLEKSGRRVTVALLLLEYLLHLLKEGGPRSAENLKVSSIYTMLNRFARPMLAVAGQVDLEDASQQDMTTLMHTVILHAPYKMRTRTLAEIRKFFSVQAQRYDLEAPEWGVLYEVAGERWVGSDPAVVGDEEINRVLGELARNVESMTADLSLSPVERRIRELQLLGFILLHASGCRPRSIHGLTLADVYLSESGDFIHLKTRGRYASIKTLTSAGFIGLRGKVWETHRAWVATWLSARRHNVEIEELVECPLFQVPQAEAGTRYAMSAVFGRIGQLMRWSTANKAGRTYWIRKHCLQRRHLAVHRKSEPRARDMLRALRESGHASILTPLCSYLCDPVTYFANSLARSAELSRAQVLDLTGASPGMLDRRWQRLAGEGVSVSELPLMLRFAQALKLPRGSWPDRDRAPIGSPPEYRAYQSKTNWVAISEAMQFLIEGSSGDVIGDWTGLGANCVTKIRQRMDELQLRTGLRFGRGGGAVHAPRLTGSTMPMQSLLEVADRRLPGIASEWVALASRVRPEAGCPLIDAGTRSELGEVLAAIGFKMLEVQGQSVPTFLPVPFSGEASYGMWPALRWVLTVSWISNQ